MEQYYQKNETRPSIWQGVIFFLILSFIIHFISLIGHSGAMINGGDTDYFTNPFLEFNRGFYTLKLESNGVPEYSPTTRILYSIPALFISLVSQSPDITNFIYFVLIFALTGLSMWILLRELNVSKPAMWIGSIFFMLNPYVYMRTHTPMIHLIYTYAALPILIVLVRKVLLKKHFAWGTALLTSLAFLLISRATNMYLLYLGLVPLLVVLLNQLPTWQSKLDLKKLIPFYSLIFVTNLMFLGPSIFQFFSYSSGYESTYINDYYRYTLQEIQSKLTVIDSLAGFGNYAWTVFYGEEKPGILGFALFAITNKTILVSLAIIPAIWGIGNLFKQKISIGILALLFLFLATGYGQPTGFLYQYIGTLPIYKNFFRDAWGYWSMPMLTLIAIGISFGVAEISQNFKKFEVNLFTKITTHALEFSVIVLILINAILYFIFPGKLISSSWFVYIPDVYYDVSAYFAKDAPSEKVLSLPATNQAYGYTLYTWKYMGPDPLSKIAPIYLQDKYFSTITGSAYLEEYNKLLTPNISALQNFLQKTGTQYIILRKDFDPSQYGVSYADWQKLISANTCFEKTFDTNSSIVVYRNNCVTNNALRVYNEFPTFLQQENNSIRTQTSTSNFDISTTPLQLCTGDYSEKTITPDTHITETFNGSCYYAPEIKTDNTERKVTISASISTVTSTPLARYCLWSDNQKRCLLESYLKNNQDIQTTALPINDKITLNIFPAPVANTKINGYIKDLKIMSAPESAQGALPQMSYRALTYLDLEKGIIKTSIPLVQDKESFVTLATQDTGNWIAVTNKGFLTKSSQKGDHMVTWNVTNTSAENVSVIFVYLPQVAYSIGFLISACAVILSVLVWVYKKITKPD